MTLTASPRARSRPAGITWTAVQSGLWVGHRDGEFAGMIEADGELGYVATTHQAKKLGAFASVAEAKAAFREG